MKSTETSPGRGIDRRQLWFLTASIFAIMALPLLGMIWYHRYPTLSLEVAATLGIFLLVSLGISMLLGFAGLLLRNFVLAFLITVVFLLHFNLFFLGLIFVFGGSLLLALFFQQRFAEFVLYVCLAMIAGSWLDNRIDPPVQMADVQPLQLPAARGPVIHILMDGFIGPDGLPGPEESQDLRETIISFFARHNFELHTRAYSHYAATIDSMTRLFNFRNGNDDLAHANRFIGEIHQFSENRWFELLDQSGYQWNVYQTEAMEFCPVELSKDINCNTFPVPSLRTIHTNLHPPLARVPVLLGTLRQQSRILTKALSGMGVSIPAWGVSVFDERMLQKLMIDVQARPDDAFFAHVLIPHSPLIYTEDCSIDYSGESWLRWTANGGPVGNSVQSRKMRYGRIVKQVECAMRMLDELFESLKSNGLYDSATIVVHGDHGIAAHIVAPIVLNLLQLNLRDYREDFSTLFAVKWPGSQFQIIDEVRSLNLLMADVASKFMKKRPEELGIDVFEEQEPFIYVAAGFQLARLNVDIFAEPDTKE